jgi:hypothetical protein
MADQQIPLHLQATGHQLVECGGLQFEASFRAPAGATLRVFGDVDGEVSELLRFDDFIEDPHYHVPADGDPRPLDAALGEPLTWFISQLRDHLGELLAEGGFAGILPSVELDAVTDNAEDVRIAMEACVPAGYVRVPGVGLRRAPA